MWIDLRCDSAVYRHGKTGMCRKLLLRYDDSTVDGFLQVKCGRCSKTKEYKITNMQAISVRA